MRQDGGSQLRAARHLAELAECARDRAHLVRPIGIGAQVDADARNERADRAGLALDHGFGQDAAQLAAVHQHIVDPLDLRVKARGPADGLRHRDRRCDRDKLDVLDRQGGMQQDGQVDARPRGGRKRATQTAAPAGLLLCEQHKAVRAAQIPLLEHGVGRGERGDDQQVAADAVRVQQRGDARRGQAVVLRGKTVALAGHAVDRKPAAAQRADGFVHRRARYAELRRESAAGQPLAARLLECLQYRILYRQTDHLPVKQ